MADRTIGDLPAASQLLTADRIPIEQGGNAKSISGQILAEYARAKAQQAAGGYAANAAQSAADAAASAAEAEAWSAHPPYIGDNGHWYVYSTTAGTFVDSELPARGAKGDQGNPGVSPEVSFTALPNGSRMTVTDAEHPSGQSIDILNGTGAGDMLSSTYDPDGTVAASGGIAAYSVPNYGKGKNLLRNWYFVGGGSQKGYGYFPINQREGYVIPSDTPYYPDTNLSGRSGTVSEYTTAVYVNSTYGTIDVGGTTYYVRYSAMAPGYVGAGYGIDGWLNSSGTHKQIVNADSVTVKVVEQYGGALQYLDESSLIDGQTYTLSVLTTDGCFWWTFSPSKSAGRQAPIGWFGVENMYSYVDFRANNKWRIFVFYSATNNNEKSVNVKAVKLELGDTQTLAHQENGVWVLNDVPDYGEELAKCQRYGFPIIDGTWKAVGVGVVIAGNRAFVHCPCPVAPRINGSAIINDLWIIQGETAYQTEKVSTVAFSVSAGEILADVYTVGNGMTVGDVVSLGTGANSGTLFLDAEIY